MSITLPISYENRVKIALQAMALPFVERVSLHIYKPYAVGENGMVIPQDGLTDLTLHLKPA